MGKIQVDEMSVGVAIGVVCKGYSGREMGDNKAGFGYRSDGWICNASQTKFKNLEKYVVGDVIGIQISGGMISFTKNGEPQRGELTLEGKKIKLGVSMHCGSQVTILEQYSAPSMASSIHNPAERKARNIVWENCTKTVKAKKTAKNHCDDWETFLSSEWVPADDATYKIRVDEKGGNMGIGVVGEELNGVWIGGDKAGFAYSSTGWIWNADQRKFAVERYVAGDVIGIQIRDGKISFTKNGTTQGGELTLLKGQKIKLEVCMSAGQVTIQ